MVNSSPECAEFIRSYRKGYKLDGEMIVFGAKVICHSRLRTKVDCELTKGNYESEGVEHLHYFPQRERAKTQN